MRRVCSRCIRMASSGLEHATSVRTPIAARPLFTSSPLGPRQNAGLPPAALRQTGFQRGGSRTGQAEAQKKAASKEMAAPPETMPFENERYLSSWTDIGIPDTVAKRLLMAYPHVSKPTPAQRALLSSIFEGKDVYLKDNMGRGKTLAISLAAISLAYKQRGQASQNSVKTVILIPSTHLQHQIERDMLILDPSFFHPQHPYSPVEEDGKRLFALLNPQADPAANQLDAPPPILVATPKAFQEQFEYLAVRHVERVFIDEPDSMLPPLPGRRYSPKELTKHPLFRHPPPIVGALNALLNIKFSQARKNKAAVLDMDFSAKKIVQTIWTSGSFHSNLRRFTKTRGWVRQREQLADFDFTSSASPRQLSNSESGSVADDPISRIAGIDPEHYALTVDFRTARIESLSNEEDMDKIPQLLVNKGQVQPSVLETLATIHTLSPPPEGTYALVVPPEGTSLDALAAELNDVGVPTMLLTPEILHDPSIIDDAETDEDAIPPILLARRSIVPGIHLPRLHTIYLLGGLDLEGISPSLRSASMGVRERKDFYTILAGRVGRLGTTNVEGQEMQFKQRIITLVGRGTKEHDGMWSLFFGRYSHTEGKEDQYRKEGDDEDEIARIWKLTPWDVEAMEEVAQELMNEA